MDENRLRYTNEKLDITIIEIKENKDKLKNDFELIRNIMNYFESNKNENLNYLNDKYSNELIYAINYLKDKDVFVSYGKPPELNESEIQYYCSTEPGSSGSPILLINNQKLIGIHYGNSNYDFNEGTLIIYAIIEFQNIKNNLLIIDNKGKIINNNKDGINNNINSKFNIKEEKTTKN